jgi:hypothetical protein
LISLVKCHLGVTGVVVSVVIPALGRLKQKDCEFRASLGYIVNSRPA